MRMSNSFFRASPQGSRREDGAAPRRRERGQSLVEIALSMVFLIWLIAAIIDLGSALFTWIALRDAAQEGAIYGSLNPTDGAGIRLRVVTASNRPLDLAQAYTDGTLAISTAISNDNGLACTGTGDGITVALVYQYTPVIPMVSAIWSTIPIHATVTDTVLLPDC
jgi:Flp pilus assembly protein TadG